MYIRTFIGMLVIKENIIGPPQTCEIGQNALDPEVYL
jgi:hypothetical protein